MNKLQTEVVKALAAPDVKEFLAEQGSEPGGMTPDAQLIQQETERWRDIAAKADIRAAISGTASGPRSSPFPHSARFLKVIQQMSYFAPPRRIETTVFTRLPDRYRRPRRTLWSDANKAGSRISFLEGPSFDVREDTHTSPTYRSAASSASLRMVNGIRSQNMTAGQTD